MHVSSRIRSATPTHDSKIFLERGFALVVTLTLMILLTLIAVGLLSLSAVSMRGSSQGSAQAEAQANARLALMIALGELQKEMGPDMRVSAESALFDQNKDTEAIDGVAQSRWLASYDAWGDWLNASYSPPGKPATSIGNTYNPGRLYYNSGRSGMFRRWMLSLPEGKESDINAPNSSSSPSDPNWVKLVGKGSLGFDDEDKNLSAEEKNKLHLVTRAYLTPVGKTGKHAWWISPENHKARIDKAKRPRSLGVDEWETAQGDTAEVGVGTLEGFEVLDDGKTQGDKLITTQTLCPAQVAEADVRKHFFDLTAHSQGVLASVRTGHLKKDLSLLFEMEASDLQPPYRFNVNANGTTNEAREPSIRPMSPDLKDRPQIKNRHFASWTNMRHYYRMYRQTSDGSPTAPGGTEGYGSLKWPGGKPVTDFVSKAKVGTTSSSDWNGSNNYWRFPVLAKLTFIYSLLSKRSSTSTPENPRYELYLVYTPVFTYWNPYNVELRIPNNQFGMMSSGYRVLPFRGKFYLGNTEDTLTTVAGNTQSATQGVVNVHSHLDSGGNDPITFKPGEFRIFSHGYVGANSYDEKLKPGFDPRAIGGELRRIGRTATTTYSQNDNPGLVLEFSNSQQHGNHQYGNTPGSLSHNPDWNVNGDPHRIPLMYMHDWFQVRQTYTPITPPATTNPGNIQRWDLKYPDPLPIGFAQLVIKGLTELDYESIPSSNPAPNNWAKDWRCRNWIQAPPSYFGSMTYLSEDPVIAHTQRLDSPYVMFFGPMRGGDMPKVVPQINNNSILGSGAAQPIEQVVSASLLELPTAPVSNLAGFSTMRINPGWANLSQTYPHLKIPVQGAIQFSTGETSLHAAEVKATAYQSGITGPGIGDSFMHPMLPRGDIYKDYDNSKSWDPRDRRIADDPNQCNRNETLVFRDYWDHTFLINDALWDDYFVSSLADQVRPGAGAALSLSKNLERFVAGDDISNTRYRYYSGGMASEDVKAEFINNGKLTVNGYSKAAKHLMVDGMFNVNSTSVAAWKALFAGIRERQAVYRDSNGALKSIKTPAGKIAITRFNTEVTDQEMDDPEEGVTMPGGLPGWSGVRFLDDDQLQKLAEECVKQVKLRGPFLNFSEFINRRLSNDQLGLMGALQSAIDYDDRNPDSKSINYRFKNGSDYMLEKSKLGNHGFSTPEAAEGSRFAGIPGYVIQSDLLKPIANTLSVRDDTFRIRAYGESLDAAGKVTARAWCEAVVQRVPEYQDSVNKADVEARRIIYSNNPNTNGTFEDNSALSASNRLFGRKFRIESFRWLNASEV